MNPNKASYNDHELIKFWPKMKPEINITISEYQSKVGFKFYSHGYSKIQTFKNPKE